MYGGAGEGATRLLFLPIPTATTFPLTRLPASLMPHLYSVAVFVTDMDRALLFYRDHLGLPLLRQGSFGAEFLEGETRLGVHPAAHPDAQAHGGPPHRRHLPRA